MSVVTVLLFAGAVAAKQPHVAFILIDDMGFNDFYTSSDLSAAWPNVAGLAKNECVHIAHYYTQPICTPTRGAFMSGRHPTRLGLQHAVITGGQDYGLPLDETTLAEKMRDVGYNTIGVGKWHLGMYNNASLPTRRGFNHFYGYLQGSEDYLTHEVGGYLDLHDDELLVTNKNGTYSTQLFTKQIIQLVKEHKDEQPRAPLFLYFPVQNVHSPLEALDEYKNSAACASVPNVDRKTFCGMAKAADDAIGQVIDYVSSSFAGEDFLYIIGGDNGGAPMAAGNNCPDKDNLCLKGAKGDLYEGGVRNNALLCSKTRIPESRRGSTYSKGLVHIMDWHATIRDLAGATDGPKSIDGLNVWDAITHDKESPRSEFLVNIDPCSGWENSTCAKESAYRWRGCTQGICGDWKLIVGAGAGTYYHVPSSSSRVEHLRVQDAYGGIHLKFPPGPVIEHQLYNMSADPNESTDLSKKYAAVVTTMKAKIATWEKHALSPCNIPDGVCYTADAKAEAAAQKSGGWVPWVLDRDYRVVV